MTDDLTEEQKTTAQDLAKALISTLVEIGLKPRHIITLFLACVQAMVKEAQRLNFDTAGIEMTEITIDGQKYNQLKQTK